MGIAVLNPSYVLCFSPPAHRTSQIDSCNVGLRVAHAYATKSMSLPCRPNAIHRSSGEASIATRFRTYAIALSPAAAAYRDALLADDGVRAWEASAAAQPVKLFSRADTDTRHPDA